MNLPPLPEPDGSANIETPRPEGGVYLDGIDAWSEPLVRAYAAEAVRLARIQALEDAAADLAQALCDDCENGVQWLNIAASAKFSKDYPHLRAAITALAKDRK